MRIVAVALVAVGLLLTSCGGGGGGGDERKSSISTGDSRLLGWWELTTWVQESGPVFRGQTPGIVCFHDLRGDLAVGMGADLQGVPDSRLYLTDVFGEAVRRSGYVLEDDLSGELAWSSESVTLLWDVRIPELAPNLLVVLADWTEDDGQLPLTSGSYRAQYEFVGGPN